MNAVEGIAAVNDQRVTERIVQFGYPKAIRSGAISLPGTKSTRSCFLEEDLGNSSDCNLFIDSALPRFPLGMAPSRLQACKRLEHLAGAVRARSQVARKRDAHSGGAEQDSRAPASQRGLGRVAGSDQGKVRAHAWLRENGICLAPAREKAASSSSRSIGIA